MKIDVTFKINDYESKDDVKKLLHHLNDSYPNFNEWFDKNYSTLKKDRKIISIFSKCILIGAVLTKEDEEESKICSFYISEEYRGYGIGDLIMKITLNLFKNDEVMLTVSNENYHSLSKFLNKYKFKIVKKVQNLYIKKEYEYFLITKKSSMFK